MSLTTSQKSLQRDWPPIIDLAAFYGHEFPAKEMLIREMRRACESYGFFQIINHGIPSDLQQSIFQQSKDLFGLPSEVKERYSLDTNKSDQGYERLRSQSFEKRTRGDLKEGIYLGKNLPLDDPYVVQGKFGQGANSIYVALSSLVEGILQILVRTLDLDEHTFDEFCEHPIAILRLLHYPTQGPDASELERGIGAHTDFGAVTILLQDETGGLQVWNNMSSEWVDRTNDRYFSTLRRRYRTPFFFCGNPDYSISCLLSFQGPNQGAKYPPVTVGEWMTGRYADTYGNIEG
ncbi:isopenicillin N synthase family dioxygenase [Aspergillus alliaceus]|uniref:isopenicillin N synthase family dioxygenase n=1 Tax=Petromyces alliaceus TaxID=209559 RepID=UPI0012A45D7B|nr:uncharacterized protein BDW43DRAFT_301613 [Aspergillus alliaceus]KAB8231683.1 hypothetical protein BDW43DRAFT_301613 [Aspergillus alliaceus]